MSKYVDIKISINVDGKTEIHKAQMEEGMHFQNNGDTYTIKNGSIWNSNNQKVDSIKMTEYQFNIFQALANNVNENDNKMTLSRKDINDKEKGALTKWSLGKFASDMSEFIKKNIYTVKGTQRLTNAEGEINGVELDVMQSNNKAATLRFWFDSSSTKVDKKNDTNTAPTEKKAENVKEKKADNTIQPQQTAKASNKLFSNIPSEYDSYIASAAKKAGVTEDVIRFFILTEGKNCKAKLEPYTDGNGVLTIGFGHTNKTGTYKFDENTKGLSLQVAFDILVKDIEVQKKLVINTIGEDTYNKLPSNVQAALLDWSFNAGVDRFQNSANFKANLEANDYVAILTTSLWNEDDARRSSFRMMFATEGMNEHDKLRIRKFLDRAMRGKEKAGIKISYYNNTMDTLVGAERKLFNTYYNNLPTK